MIKYQIELLLDTNSGDHLAVCKQIRSDSFKNNVAYKLFVYRSYIYIYIYKQNLELNNLQRLICHKI